MTLEAHAQAKLSLIDEEAKKLQALQINLRHKEEKLDADRRSWLAEREQQRIVLAAEREANVADLKASLKSLKKEQQCVDAELEQEKQAFENLASKHEKSEQENCQLRLSLTQLQVKRTLY